MRKKIGILIISLLVSLLVVEGLLRIIKPFGFRMKGNAIVLPKNQQWTFYNQPSDKLDPFVIHNQNSLGFRGDKPPDNFSQYLTLITVGGSTTESIVLNDSETWTAVLGDKLSKAFLNVWVNNAGIDGHTTFGHLILVKDFIAKIHPDVVVFLIGINEIGLEAQREFDRYHLGEEIVIRGGSDIKEKLVLLAEQSEIASVFLNIYRYVKARERGLAHTVQNFKKNDPVVLYDFSVNYQILGSSDVSDSRVRALLEEHKKYIQGYRSRLEKLVQLTQEAGSIPVLVTQPAVYGYAIDDVTGVDLASIIIKGSNGVEGEGMTGKENWEVLELYNDVTREVGLRQNVLVIDAAAEMPKSTQYYYDYIHFEKKGSEKVADLIYEHLCPYLQKTFSTYVKAQC